MENHHEKLLLNLRGLKGLVERFMQGASLSLRAIAEAEQAIEAERAQEEAQAREDRYTAWMTEAQRRISELESHAQRVTTPAEAS